MKNVRIGLAAFALLLPLLLVFMWVRSADERLESYALQKSEAPPGPVASAADEGYCSVGLKKVLRRVLQSCGLLGKDGSRGCQPLQAKNLATVSGADFNALFKPMRERGAIVQFDVEKAELDMDDEKVLEQVFSDQRGASYFFVVARSSPDGEVEYNRNLSKGRAEAVLSHLEKKFEDPDLEQEVG